MEIPTDFIILLVTKEEKEDIFAEAERSHIPAHHFCRLAVLNKLKVENNEID